MNPPPLAAAADFDQNAGFVFEVTAPDARQSAGHFVRRHGGEKAKTADVDPEHRRGRAGDFAGNVQHRAVAAKHQQQVHFARQRGGVAAHGTFQSGQPGGPGVAQHLSSGALNEPRGFANAVGAGGLVGIADQPDAFDFVSLFFQSAPKIPCCPPVRATVIPPHPASATRIARGRIPAVH